MYKAKLSKYSVAELDSMEQKLRISLSLVRGVRNLLQPVNRLPPELLILIFHQTQQHLSDFLPMPHPSPSSWHWLSLLQVCRHWRGLIATSPQLWSELDSALLPERFLKRSSVVPLKVYLGPKLDNLSEGLLESIAHQSNRFQELHLDADSWQSSAATSGTMFHQFKFPAPILTSLTLVTDGRGITNGILPQMFGGEMPSLKKLCLKHLTAWPRGYFQSLTHVCLYDQNESTRPTMDEFLDFLASSPSLEELALVRAGPTRTDVGTQLHSPLSKTVFLPNLRQLDIGEWSSASLVARFLSHLHLPPNTDMYFWGERMLNATHSDSEFARGLALLLPEDISKLENMRHIKKWYLARQPRVILDTPFVSVTGCMEGEGRVLYMYGTFSASQLLPIRLLSRYPVSEVECLAVRDSCTDTNNANSLDVGFWREVLRGLPRLKKLEILAFRSVGFTRAVIGALMPETNTPSLLCSQLTSLTIEHDLGLPAYFVRSMVEARARCTPPATPLENLRVLVFEPSPSNNRRRRRLRSMSSSISIDSDSEADGIVDIRSESDVRTREEEEYRMHTEDDRRLLEECVEILGEVQFEYGVPLSVGLVPDAWPTLAYEFTRGRRAVA
ncbi:hypothetical protein F5051DRAFT_444931 [Lentinula edodes]|nr:hypothetical protein F5051DRAFT_444931 [Lentinula edodes]